jgi:hypothetical protein
MVKLPFYIYLSSELNDIHAGINMPHKGLASLVIHTVTETASAVETHARAYAVDPFTQSPPNSDKRTISLIYFQNCHHFLPLGAAFTLLSSWFSKYSSYFFLSSFAFSRDVIVSSSSIKETKSVQ